MTPKERLLAASTRQPVDVVPCVPIMNFQDWPQRLGKRWNYPFGPSVREARDYMIGELGVDQLVDIGWGMYPEDGVTSRVWAEGDVVHKAYTTPSGVLQAAVRVDDNWPHGFDVPFLSDYNSSHFVEPWVTGMEDVDCLRHILLPPRSESHFAPIRFGVADSLRHAERYTLPVCFHGGLGLTGALNMFGATELCLMCAERPEIVDAYLEVDHRMNMANYQTAMDFGVDMIRRNGFYESCDYYSPEMLERFLGRRIREEVRLAHDGGTVIGYTLLTGIMPMLDYLATLGFDCLFWPDLFLQGADAAAIEARLGATTAFWTGPSDTVHLPWDRPDEVRNAVRHVFDVFGKEGLVLTTCSSSKAVFPWDNVVAMIDEWKKLR